MSVVVSKARTGEITVAKFGGTSVADYQAMMRCAHIIKNDACNRVVVVSASAGVTNKLVRLSQENVAETEREEIISAIGNIQFAITQHLTCQANLDLEIAELLKALTICAEKQATAFSLQNSDQILSFGEQLSSRIFAQVLQTVGVNGHYFDVRQVMKTDDLYGKAQVDLTQLASNAQALLLRK